MRRVLIVDDEPVIVEGLYAVLTQCDLDIDVYKAGGGEEALRLLSDVRMDAVISDIRMPGMDGLQLMERIHSDWPKCRVIFLSGYNEFDALYKAVRGPAVTFLLKTEGFDKIVAALAETLSALERERQAVETRELLGAQRALTRHMLGREALSSLILGEEDAQAEARLNSAGLNIKADKLVLPLYSYVEAGAEGLTLEAFHEKLIALDQLVRLSLEHYPIEAAFWNRRENLMWLFQPGEELAMARCALYIRENLELIQDSARAETGLSLAFAMDIAPVSLSELPRAYLRLRMRVCESMGVPGMIALNAPEAGGGEALVSPAVLERLKELLEHQNREEFTRLLKRAAGALRHAERMSDPYALEAYMQLAQLYVSYINRWKLHERVQLPGGLASLSSVSRYANWSQAADSLTNIGESLMRDFSAQQGGRAQKVMAQIKEHIESHLSDPDALSLLRIAEKTYFNPAYLSRLFKQTTGETISDYVSRARVRRANELLSDPRLKIGDIARAVGFSSSANFARFYRKMMDCTPQEYRDGLGFMDNVQP